MFNAVPVRDASQPGRMPATAFGRFLRNGEEVVHFEVGTHYRGVRRRHRSRNRSPRTAVRRSPDQQKVR